MNTANTQAKVRHGTNPVMLMADVGAAYWHAQVSLRLRRELVWCWHQRAQIENPGTGVLPPVVDELIHSLDQGNYSDQKQRFFERNDAARQLSGEITALGGAPMSTESSLWCWLADHLALSNAAQFVLALGLVARMDAGLSPVFASCMNDLSRPFPTLALAQRLWDSPLDMMLCADLNHEVFRFGLLNKSVCSDGQSVWLMPVEMPAMLSRQFCNDAASLPVGLSLVDLRHPKELDQSAVLLAEKLKQDTGSMSITPLLGAKDAAFDAWAASISQKLGHRLVRVDGALLNAGEDITAFASLCWMYGLDILLPDEWMDGHAKERMETLLAAQFMPLRWYLPVYDVSQLQRVPQHLLTPMLNIKPLSFEQRLLRFKQGLGVRAAAAPALDECARRFRFQDQAIKRITDIFSSTEVVLNDETLTAACSNEAIFEMGHLAEPVVPRFCLDELVLPDIQARQFQEILHAMGSLTVVHYHWGTARAWNESGLSVLFCGAPGTGKTMAAEVLASELQLPMFRIDLSQVVNKYIGETEKNLRRIFDAAELSDCILFFDEADALFGKRTEVKDAHDRFANIEISYLLERMERFKGLAILATNRRRDLDGAFMRRLRYVIEFPVPEAKERMRIWQQAFPDNVDISALDVEYLAGQFAISGGHIRSIAFNACLASARSEHSSEKPVVLMPAVVIAVKRELEKLDRSSSHEMFGDYAALIREAGV